MEQWDREALYADVWEQPLSKLTQKYGISAVALGKVCRKLKIPVPGRGYWAKKEFGKPVKRLPLPASKDLPVVWRMKFPSPEGAKIPAPAPEPTDPEWFQIKEMESRAITIPQEPKFHKLVTAALRNLEKAKPNQNGILQSNPGSRAFDVRVSQSSLDRALRIMSAVIEVLVTEGFPVTTTEERHGTFARVFGHLVSFGIVEKLTLKGRRQVKEYSWTRTIMDYEPNGKLEFRVGHTGYGAARTLRDGKKQKLEDMIAKAVGAMMREGRELGIREEQRKRDEIARQQRIKEQLVLADQIREEEKKLKQLEGWVSAWARAKEMRDFISALERLWVGEGYDLSTETEKGQRLVWMKQQADRADPLVTRKPASVLDRKNEVGGWM